MRRAACADRRADTPTQGCRTRANSSTGRCARGALPMAARRRDSAPRSSMPPGSATTAGGTACRRRLSKRWRRGRRASPVGSRNGGGPTAVTRPSTWAARADANWNRAGRGRSSASDWKSDSKATSGWTTSPHSIPRAAPPPTFSGAATAPRSAATAIFTEPSSLPIADCRLPIHGLWIDDSNWGLTIGLRIEDWGLDWRLGIGLAIQSAIPILNRQFNRQSNPQSSIQSNNPQSVIGSLQSAVCSLQLTRSEPDFGAKQDPTRSAERLRDLAEGRAGDVRVVQEVQADAAGGVAGAPDRMVEHVERRHVEVQRGAARRQRDRLVQRRVAGPRRRRAEVHELPELARGRRRQQELRVGAPVRSDQLRIEDRKS